MAETDKKLLAVIADYDNRFPEFKELKTQDDIANTFVEPEKIKQHILLSESKLWMTHHPRVAIDKSGTQFDDVSSSS